MIKQVRNHTNPKLKKVNQIRKSKQNYDETK